MYSCAVCDLVCDVVCVRCVSVIACVSFMCVTCSCVSFVKYDVMLYGVDVCVCACVGLCVCEMCVCCV